ncbi:hypothetical protein BC962_2345 [Gillisia mitskevichiae]|uniref:Uncharacterized protein n=1 Tax=Gillisia mitskevichiae TaxID=270921 RepID=A0A495PIK6_9FLAO|nr:hypothetical protein [Gillisia mitskevichiae]RKS50574.1 hypothetical protein BC962_2345 [Gillisia mitskevichiae]
MNVLSLYHLGFGGVYYIYALFNRSDSVRYYNVPQNINKTWLDFLGTETTFIDFISYPFINYLGFSYEMMMLLFTWVGFMGFVNAYLFFKENIPLDVKVFKKVDLLTLILFLPNMHFWTASLGKGALIFLGLMLFGYAISRPKERILTLIIGSLLVFYIRPHIFLILAIGSLLGFLTGVGKFTWKHKGIVIGVCIVSLVLLQNSILSVVNLENSNHLISDFLKFTSHRAESLSNSGSGLNMAEYSLPEKIFSFWFRPLFFDAPGILGVIISVENLIYILLFIKIFKWNFIKFIKLAPVNVKMSLALFLITSFAMTFVMSNLGIIIRQKSMIMYFIFFVIYYYLAHEKQLKSGEILNIKPNPLLNVA